MQLARKKAELNDVATEQQLETDGYILLRNVIPPQKIKQLKELYESLHVNKNDRNDMWNSLYNLPNGQGMKVSHIIQPLVLPYLEPLFKSLKVMMYTYMVKNPVEHTFCKLHRDYSSFDEDVFEYRNAWIPLVEVNETNGALLVVPKSHGVFEYCLPMFTDWPYENMLPELMKKAKVIQAQPGDMVIYKDRTLHGSEQNRSHQTRPVLHFGLLHPEASLSYYHLNRIANEVEVYEVDVDFYFQKNYEEALTGRSLVKHFIYSPPCLKMVEVEKKMV